MLQHLDLGGRFVVSSRVVIDQVVVIKLIAVELVNIRMHLCRTFKAADVLGNLPVGRHSPIPYPDRGQVSGLPERENRTSADAELRRDGFPIVHMKLPSFCVKTALVRVRPCRAESIYTRHFEIAQVCFRLCRYDTVER